jgi:hypothetical protein
MTTPTDAEVLDYLDACFNIRAFEDIDALTASTLLENAQDDPAHHSDQVAWDRYAKLNTGRLWPAAIKLLPWDKMDADAFREHPLYLNHVHQYCGIDRPLLLEQVTKSIQADDKHGSTLLFAAGDRVRCPDGHVDVVRGGFLHVALLQPYRPNEYRCAVVLTRVSWEFCHNLGQCSYPGDD